MRMKFSRILAAFAVTSALLGCNAPQPIAATPPQATVLLGQGVERLDVRFPCEATQCAAWVYLPAGDTKPPVVVMAHGFAGTRDVALDSIAEHFAQQGMAAFVFDYRHFGSSGGAPRQLVDPWRQLEDWRAALAFVRAHSRVDGSRVALWSTSLGGGLALVTAAADGVRCVVAQVPQIDSSAEGEATFPGAWWLVRLLLTAWSDLSTDVFGGAPLMIPVIAPADGFGMIVDDRAFEAFQGLVRRGSTYRNEVAARSIFTFDDYNPAVQAASIKIPVLLIASRTDRFVPFAAVEAFAKARSNVTLKEIEGDHFEVYSAPAAEHAAELASLFLGEHLSR
jgi:uncharacterized protein